MYNKLSAVPGLQPVIPLGAMYMMVGIDLTKFPNLTSAIDLMEKLMCEESVYCLPGEVSTIGIYNTTCYFRVTLQTLLGIVICTLHSNMCLSYFIA